MHAVAEMSDVLAVFVHSVTEIGDILAFFVRSVAENGDILAGKAGGVLTFYSRRQQNWVHPSEVSSRK